MLFSLLTLYNTVCIFFCLLFILVQFLKGLSSSVICSFLAVSVSKNTETDVSGQPFRALESLPVKLKIQHKLKHRINTNIQTLQALFKQEPRPIIQVKLQI